MDGLSVGKCLTPSWYTIHPNKSSTRMSEAIPTSVLLPCMKQDPTPSDANAFAIALTLTRKIVMY